MAVVIDTFADEDRMKQDIDQVGTTNVEILDLILRSNEDASSRLEAIFLENVDFDNLPGWFVDLATRLAVKIYWDKSNGTPESSEKIKFYKKNAEKLREKSRKIYAQNPEKAIQKTKKWQINNPQKYKESHDKYRQNNLEKIRENDRKRNAAFKLKVFIHYSHGTLKCNCCGEMTFGFLTLDHINNDGHRQRKKGLNSTGLMPYLIKNNYPSGFQILCYNCNCGRAHTPDKKCPHLL